VAVGYSGTPLARKLGVVPGCRLLVIDAPAGFLGPTLEVGDATLTTAARAPFDVGLLFVTRRSDLERRLPALWVCWPKKASKVPTDMTEHVVRDVCLPLQLVDNKVCAVDDVWSGLRVVVRREHRAAWPGG
jgi:hypothetical protein